MPDSFDEFCQEGDGLLIVPFGITYSVEYGHAGYSLPTNIVVKSSSLESLTKA